jgi:hypothetical protein
MGGVEANFGKRSDRADPRVRLDELQRVGTRTALRARGASVGEALSHDCARLPSPRSFGLERVTQGGICHSASLTGWTDSRAGLDEKHDGIARRVFSS